MPKTVDGYICTNGHGALVLQTDNTLDDFYSYSLTELTGDEEHGLLINTHRVYTVSIYKCPECGYIELYDKE